MNLKKALKLFLALCLALSILVCGVALADEAPDEPKVLKLAESFAYPSLDVHKDYYG